MIINHHFRVELKAHKFNSSTVNKRFSHPVTSNLTSHFLSPTSLGHYQLIAVTRDLPVPSHHTSIELLSVLTAEELFFGRQGKDFFLHVVPILRSSYVTPEAEHTYISRPTNHHVILYECPEEFFQGPVCWDPSQMSP